MAPNFEGSKALVGPLMPSNTSAAPAAAVDPEAVDPTRTPAALWQMLRSLEQRVASAEAEVCEAKLEVPLTTEAARSSAEAKARAEKRAAAAFEQRAAVTEPTAAANALAAAALCQQRRQDWAAAAKAKAERLQASAEQRAEEAAPRRPLAPFAHHNHATSHPPASPAVTHRDRAAASPNDHDGGGGATGCDGRCGGPCTDGGGCGVWLQAPRPPATAALPTAGIDGGGGASSLEPQTG